MGTEVEVLDIHDGELLPTLENRKTIVKLIREWDADIVLLDWYGAEAGAAVKHAEAFELCEYGSKPSKDQLRILFPFFKQ